MIVRPHQLKWLEPDWPAPQNVRAFVSTRAGRLSSPPFDGFNTADHVGAPASQVESCRRVFCQHHGIQSKPQWLDQVHGTDVVEAKSDGLVRRADACFTSEVDVVCTLHTADCLPVFFSDRKGSQIALAHAGWRGLESGILERTIETFSLNRAELLCWLGPAISQHFFEVGAEVKVRFEQSQSVPDGAFIPSGRVSEAGEHFLCDLFLLAKERLLDAGVTSIFGANLCTYSDPRFFSYRQQSPTGRILSAMWLSASI